MAGKGGAGGARTALITCKVTPAEKRRIARAARKAKVTVSGRARQLLLEDADLLLDGKPPSGWSDGQ